MHPDRREFLQQLATATGSVILVPAVFSVPAWGQDSQPTAILDVPTSRPEGWDAIAFNRERGNAGAIPETYHASINGPDGVKKHLGKHLPYVPKLDADVPEGHVALMWGDPDKGYAQHPNAPRNESNNNEGHWYNWIRIRKASDGEAEELESRYSEWPQVGPDDNGAYVVHGDAEITADGGKHTVYLAALPTDLEPGDVVRIHAHCLTHGEWVDFLTV